MHKCRVPGCSSVSQLVRFPRDEEQIQKWISVIQNPLLDHMTIGLLYKIERICVDHFEDKCFSNESTVTNKILLNHVEIVPTLSLPGINLIKLFIIILAMTDIDTIKHNTLIFFLGSKENIKCIAHQNNTSTSQNTKHQVINNDFAKRLKTTILNLPALDRICVLLFKTVKISPKLEYNSNYDMIFGWQTTNTVHKNAFAKKAIVFMARGLYSNWKQMISFVFCDDEITPDALIQSLKDVISTCFSLRLKIIATICEESQFFVEALNKFSKQSHEKCLHDDEEYGYQSFTVNNHEVIVLYDVLHLYRKVQTEFSKWKTDDFNVLNCDNNNLEGMMRFFNGLFNSLDGSAKRTDTNNVKINVTLTSEHWDLWIKGAETLENMKKIEHPPSCLPQWTTTLFGVMHLWRGILQRSNFKSFSPRFLQLRELNKVIRKIRSYKKEPIRYMDYDEISYAKYLAKMTNKINSKHKKKFTCNTFIKSFKNEISNFQDNSLPLCDATRPLLFEKIQQITDKDFNDYDYRNLDLGMTKHSKPLISAPEFYQFDYEPILYFENSILDNWTLNINQMLKLVPLKKIQNSVKTDMERIFLANNCSDCNIFDNKTNFRKIFQRVVLVILRDLPFYYNKPKISENLGKSCKNNCNFDDFENCLKHNLLDVFMDCCVLYVIKFWVLRVNRCLARRCNFYSNMDLITKQAVLIGRKGTFLSSFKNRKNGLYRRVKK